MRPNHAEAHNSRGVVLFDIKRYKEALESYDKALALRQDYAAAHNNRGVVLVRLNRFEDALTSYRKATEFRPDYAEAFNNLGSLFIELRRPAEALASLDRALEIRPKYANALFHRGIALDLLRRPAEALEDYDRALAMRSDFADALRRRSDALRHLYRFEEALASADQAVSIRGDLVEAHISRGLALKELRRFDEALASFAKAQELAPDDGQANYQEAVLRLLNGDLSKGLAKYGWRNRRERAGARPAKFAQRPWDGLESLYDRTILLHAERRLSDSIQFCRYVPLVAARGARVILQVPQPLLSLFGSLAGVAQLLSDDERTPLGFDTHCPLPDLPMAFGTRLDSIPSGVPYLRPPTDALLAWETRFNGRPRPRIGIAWAGNPDGEHDRVRSIELRTVLPLFGAEATWVRLQRQLRPGDEELLQDRGDIFDPTEWLGDVCDIAALISRLDLVISVDTGIAHLAGALGKPVWILLPFTPDWRWLLGRSASNWYPTSRLYRQVNPGDWDEVIARVVADRPSALGREAAPAPAPRNKPRGGAGAGAPTA